MATKSYFEVRFHLGRGLDYLKWQIKRFCNGEREITYLDPAQYQLELTNCVLINKINKAKDVYSKGVKDVCGWIRCDMVVPTREQYPSDYLERLFYNPIIEPHWKRSGDGGSFTWDGFRFQTLLTNDRRVYILEERE